MDISLILLIIIVILLWSFVFIVACWRIDTSAVSINELKRRAQKGDSKALEQLSRLKVSPKLRVIRYILMVFSLTAATSVTFLLSGFAWTIVIVIVLGLLYPYLKKLAFMQRSSDILMEKFEKKITPLIADARWMAAMEQPEILSQLSINSLDELRELLAHSQKSIGKKSVMQLQASIDFTHKKVKDYMTPVSQLKTISRDEMLGPLVLDDLHRTGHSRFPVIGEDENDIVGLLYLPEITQLDRDSTTVVSVMDERPLFIREDQTLTHALHGILRHNHHLFIVVNKDKETVGVVSLSDIVESLFGQKIIDTFDEFDDLDAVASHNVT